MIENKLTFWAYLLFFSWLISPLFLQGQSSLPKERIFVDTDKSIYLTGETLWFKIYCLDASSHQLSGLSKIAYLELLDGKGKPIIQEKIKLENGTGNGQIFIQKNVLSGVYYLKVYTSWMKNFDQQLFFESNIQVVNPFYPIEVKEADSSRSSLVNSLSTKDLKLTDNLEANLEKNDFGNREKVKLSLALKDAKNIANLSVSVYKYHSGFAQKPNINNYLEKKSVIPNEKPKTFQYPPEIVAPLLSGKVKNNLIDRVDVFLPGDVPQYYSIPVNSNHVFHTEISPQIATGEMLFWTENQRIKSEDIEIFSPFFSKHKLTNPVSLGLNKDDKAVLEKLSMNTQIANAYVSFTHTRGEIEKDSFAITSFYGKPDVVYKLDDYTRFPTLDEVFLEYVRFIVKKKREKKEYFFAWDLYANGNSISNNFFFKEPALVMIDGVPISDLSYVWKLSANLVEKIEIVNRKYYAGEKIIYGLINIETYKKDFGKVPFPPDIVKKEFIGLMEKKAFFAPDYDKPESEMSRIPDYRTVLFWEPDLTLSSTTDLEFFTGDDSGRYRIEINGITNNGLGIYKAIDFQVNNNR